MDHSRLKRRRFFRLSIKAMSLAGLGGVVYSIERFLSPTPINYSDYNPHGSAPAGAALASSSGEVPTSAEVPADSIPVGQSRMIAIGYVPVLVVHQSQGFTAFNATCLHLGCLVKWEPETNEFVCPCHAGRYNAAGQNILGPPPAPLKPCRVEVNGATLKVSVS